MKTKSAADHPGVIAFPPLIWLACVSLSWLTRYLWPSPIMSRDVSLPIGLVLILLAPALATWAGLLMKRSGTNVNPSRPALTIVRSGPFRFTRNPMYLALCLLQLGLGFLLNDWSTLLFVLPLALVLHYGVILREEKYLSAKFGDQYLALKRDVRRWL